MANRRKLSFDLLRYVDVPAPNEDALAIKSHSRRRRHKKKSVNFAHATLDNGQIYSNDALHLGDSSSLRKCATVDIGCLADLSMDAAQQLAVSDAVEMVDGTILSCSHDANGNEPDTLNSLLGHADGPNGILHFERVDSVESEGVEGLERSFSIAYSVVEDVSNKLESGLLEQVSPAESNCKVGFLEQISPAELRQRNVNVNADAVEGNGDEIVEEVKERGSGALKEPQPEKKASHATPQLLDWERVMAETSEFPIYSAMSPLGYFLREINRGNSLRSTTSVGNDKERQKVYNTMFHVPWRCELFQIPLADDLSDFGCFVVLIWGVTLLQVTDISLIYHFIRGQGTIKLYVVYNVLEIFDKLCQSFGGDVLQVLFNSAAGVASSSKEHMAMEIMRFILDEAIAVVAFIVHSFIILAQAITLSAAIIAHNNALMALLVSNNFAEIKSNVFKRVSTENLHKMAYYDTVERFHIMAYVIFVLAQNILEAESPWLWSFVMNSCMIWSCEVLVDVIKHAFLVKFNEIKPDAYSEFLEALCKQTLNNQSHEAHKALTFVPLAPACVVIRALTPIYASRLPFGPVWWRWFWIVLLFTVTYLMLASLKVVVGLGLQTHARWYIRRCLRKQRHLHAD
ncbi:protein POLLEN DEFECTIVE IN GUIDANCE 1 isoform X2 [Cryptomeria japonica]|uniref:protein POLLEN DEFECTIVE IN GUIDANCE 1 isoform X2 n=1 Tax=Cryptomeria japonica TaxID=3369 RepID=UPI0025AD5A86|nr:protein POLLEN DEFECTIVE IN GUIDANCE 1 isoform X2 [Cryptomeria japonica]